MKIASEELQLIEQQIVQLNQEIASLLRQHKDAIRRLAEVHGPRVESAQQNIPRGGKTTASSASCDYSRNNATWFQR